MKQNKQIKEVINRLLDEGWTDKQKIYTKVCQELNLPRPTVRRVWGEFLYELKSKVSTMEGGQVFQMETTKEDSSL